MADEKTPTRTPTVVLIRALETFLASPDPDVLCIRGEWGVGKTFTWDATLKSAEKKKKIALGTYAYVSLFGTQTLDQLRYSIFENRVKTKNIGVEPSLETLSTNTQSVIETIGKKFGLTLLEAIPGAKNAASALQTMSFLAINQQIICFDDLERRGKDLRLVDVLGLFSFLKERRKCKVVLILNDEALDTDDKAVLESYQEKVIDTSVLFAPTPEECAAIAINGDDAEIKLLREFSILLGISNIRIITKIKRLVSQIRPIVSGLVE